MTTRALIVPAAGAGTRLGADLPKLLVPVAGRPMIDRILDLHAAHVSDVVVVVSPLAEPLVRRHLSARPRCTIVVQERPTGMLDAIMLAIATAPVRAADYSWITWCDQVAVHHDTIAELARLTASPAGAALVVPTLATAHPYVHLERDPAGRIIRVLHRREGDVMPAQGESDIGLFSLSREAAVELLPRYARTDEVGGGTGERNFLPFIPWMSARDGIVTFPSQHSMDALGVNTREELHRVEAWLSSGEA